MSQFFSVHPEQPQLRLIRQAVEIIRGGGIVAFPTDAAYSLGCHIGDADAVARIRKIRGVDESHHFTLMCRDLSEISNFAKVDNAQFRLLKTVTPGSYTFILEATKELPRRLLNPKRKTIGLRIPNHVLVLALLEELNEPMLTSTLKLPDDELPLNDVDEIRARLEHRVDLVIEAGHCGIEMTTVVDLSGAAPVLIREGCGLVAPLGLD